MVYLLLIQIPKEIFICHSIVGKIKKNNLGFKVVVLEEELFGWHSYKSVLLQIWKNFENLEIW